MTTHSHGLYHYWRNGSLSDVRETWVSTPWPAGRRRVHSVRTAPSFGSTLAVTAVMHGDHLEWFEVQWHNTSPGAVPQASAHYTMHDHSVQVQRVVNGITQPTLEIARPPHVVVSPLLRVFHGPAIRQLAAQGAGQLWPVLVPYIEDPRQAERLLTPVIDQRGAQDLGEDTALVDDQPVAVRRYAYLSGRYTDKAVFYLTPAGVLARYTFAESADLTWDVRLSQHMMTE